jgi:hypothetical protein
MYPNQHEKLILLTKIQNTNGTFGLQNERYLHESLE